MSHRARKRFGQNFLVDRAVIQRIIEAVNPTEQDLVIEIGPGQGALTAPLSETGAELIALEIDRDLARTLEARFEGYTCTRIVQGDALETDFGAVSGGRPYRLVGNLPYNISTPLIFHVLESGQAALDMHFTLQKEVVDRLAAAPGGKDYGRLGIMCQNRCEVTPLFTIGREAFSPVPRVESAFVRLKPRPQPISGAPLAATLDRVVRQAFSQRRKTLRNSLSGLLDPTALAALGIDPGLRAEQLTLDEFIRLARLIKQGHDE
jgi:16S rRNA (adenine1518-N6/adenine1519-N6)-dimethyltransferase